MKKTVLLIAGISLCLLLGCASKEVPEDLPPLTVPEKPPAGMGAGPQDSPQDAEPAPSKKLDG